MIPQRIHNFAKYVKGLIEADEGKRIKISNLNWELLCDAITRLEAVTVLSEEEDILVEAVSGDDWMEELYGDLDGWQDIRNLVKEIKQVEAKL